MDYSTLVELTDRFVEELVPLPEPADDVCPHCQSSKPDQQELCWSCSRVYEAIGRPCPTVIPISFYMTPGEDEPVSPLRERMHDYKDHDDPAHRAESALGVGAILARYLVEHGEALRELTGGWDVMTAVPSKKGRPGRPALALALGTYEGLVGPIVDLLTPGPGTVGHYSPNAEGFVATERINGVRVLMLDDTFTTGATLQSAAQALKAGGAEVVAGVVVARKINPDLRFPESVAIWDRQRVRGFRFTDPPFWTQS